MSASYSPTARSKVRRHPERAAYDETAVHAVLDAAVLAHVGYVIEGQPFVTPTAFWREGRKLYWHGSAASRMLRAQGSGLPVCLTVSHLDGLVLARSGFVHSLNFRSAMCFGKARLVEGLEAKRAATDAFIDRMYPERTATLRPATDSELKQIHVVEMTIEEASAKVRAGGVSHLDIDEPWSAWSGVVPVAQVVSAPIADAVQSAGVDPGPSLSLYRDGARLDDVFAATACPSRCSA